MKYFFQTILKTYGNTRTIKNLTFIEIVLQLVLLAIAFRFGIYWITISQIVALGIIMLFYLRWYMKIEEMSLMQIITSIVNTTVVPLIVFAIVLIGYLYWDGCISVYVNILFTLMSFGVLFVLFNELIRPSMYMNYRKKLVTKKLNNK